MIVGAWFIAWRRRSAAGTLVATSGVGLETAFVEPERFVAVTTTRSVLPVSTERTP